MRLASDHRGNLFVLDDYNGIRKIRKIDNESKVTTLLSDVSNLVDIFTDKSGNIYFFGDGIYKINLGNVTKVFNECGSGMDMDSLGNIYFTNMTSINRLDSNGD